jgi:pheromone a factor receptor
MIYACEYPLFTFLALASRVISALALHHFFVRRVTFARHLQDKTSALTTSRYFRLIAMAIVQMCWGVLVFSSNMWFTCRTGLREWISWDDVHSDFGRVAQYPSAIIPPFVQQFTFFMWWTIPASALLFFVFFAFGQDAMKEYIDCFRWVRHFVVRKDQGKAL